jgi:hypothetical protein
MVTWLTVPPTTPVLMGMETLMLALGTYQATARQLPVYDYRVIHRKELNLPWVSGYEGGEGPTEL